MSNLSFTNNNPGATKHGNFINYYTFHSPEERINLLSKSTIWQKIANTKNMFIMDVGCNSGDLSIKLCEFLQTNVTENCHCLAIDIDPILIERAKEHDAKNIDFECMDFMCPDKRTAIINKYLHDNETDEFDAIFCFSITMWIHLNHGDEGLRAFLKELSSKTKLLIIEPQPWKCYKAAIKRMGKQNAFPLFKELRLTNNIEREIETMLVAECGMKKLDESAPSSWKRTLYYFSR